MDAADAAAAWEDHGGAEEDCASAEEGSAPDPPSWCRPLSSLAPDELRAVQDAARARLRELGAPSALKKASRAARMQASMSSTPGPKTPGRGASVRGASAGGARPFHARVFGRPLRDLSMVLVPELGEDVLVPKVAAFLCDWLRREGRLRTEGLFRKPGSASRQRQLKCAMEESEGWTEALADASPLDVAGLVKQWLRELPEPLLPLHVQKLLLECWEFTDPARRLEGLTLCASLLPANHASSLTYLAHFFSEVSFHSEANKMDSSNLSIVLTPAFFPMDDGAAAAGKRAGGHEKLPQMMQIVESVIQQKEEVGRVPPSVEKACGDILNQQGSSCQSEDNLDDDDPSSGHHGPSERRMKKKKRRSGSISRVFSATVKGIQKAMSRSATPVAPRSHSVGCSESLHATPVPLSVAPLPPRFTSPRLPAKRKAKEESELSPTSKQQRRMASVAASSSSSNVEMTPKMRGRSFSVKRFKQNSSKSFKVSSENVPAQAVLHNFSPLPSRPSLKIATPSTPAHLGIPRQGTDILTPPSNDSSISGQLECVSADAANMEDINVSMASLMTTRSTSSSTSSLSSCATIRSRASLASALQRQRSKSPVSAERKIGATRKQRSPPERKASANGSYEKHKPPQRNKATSKPALQNIQVEDLKAHLRRSSHAAGSTPNRASKSSPLKVPPLQTGSASSSAAKGKRSSTKKSNQQSIINLREDISSFIEQSFGASDISGVQSFDAVDTTDIFAPSTSARQPTTSSAFHQNIMRRQSSAFEFSRPAASSSSSSGLPAPVPELRRQSSAFEIAARNRERHPQSYECFNRVETRASLRRKNSSVRDLVQKLEASATKGERKEPKPWMQRASSANTSSSSSNGGSSSFIAPKPVPAMPDPEEAMELEEEDFSGGWTDAAEFFKNPLPKQLMEDDFGCKRSSIIRIRKENKGKVSQSVECFTRPTMPPPMSAPRHKGVVPSTGSGKMSMTPVANRRMSARMGVSSAAAKSPGGAPVTPLQNKRHTRTGIRTSVNHKHSSGNAEKKTKGCSVESGSSKSSSVSSSSVSNGRRSSSSASSSGHGGGASSSSSSSRDTILVKTPDTLSKRNRKSGVTGGRRHLTIGYMGEVRSPLVDRQNRVAGAATVQRSKSAQTPLQSKPAKRSKGAHHRRHQDHENEHLYDGTNNALLHHHMVTRSQSMRSPAVGGGVVTISLPEGNIAYGGNRRQNGTPRSGGKVRRHKSERSAAGRGHAGTLKMIAAAAPAPVTKTTAKSPRMVKMY